MSTGAVTVHSVQELIGALSGSICKPTKVTGDFFNVDEYAFMLQGVQLALALSHNVFTSSLNLKLHGTSASVACVILEAVKHNITLKSFSISGCDHGDQIGMAMAEAMRQNTTLQKCSIDLSCTQAGDETGVALAEAMRQNTTLQKCGIDLSDTQVGEETGLALAEAMRQNTTLQTCSINWFYTRVGDETGLAMAEAMRQNTTLQTCSINLSDTQVGEETGLALAEAMRQNTTVQKCSIDLSSTELGDETGLAMAEAMKQNTTLQKCDIYLRSTQVGDETGLALAEAMRQNTTLQTCSIDLSDTQVGDATGLALAEAIAQTLSRNASLSAHKCTLLQLARWDSSTGFQSLKQGTFRNQILEFFFPPVCGFQPLRPTYPKRSVAGLSPREPSLEETLATIAGVDLESSTITHESMKDEQLNHAISASMIEASERENSDLAVALIRSKVDAVPSVDEVGLVRLRLTRCARMAEVANAISTSPHLAGCRAMVAEAGCDLRPQWAGGAWILLPLTREQFEEAGLELGAVHILAFGRDEDAVRSALRSVAKEKRPKVKAEALRESEMFEASGRADDGSSGRGRHLQSASSDTVSEEVDLVIERTFIHFPIPREAPTSYSAPF